MLSEIRGALALVGNLTKASERGKRSVVKKLGDLESCAKKYKKALEKDDISAMRQTSAEFTELVHAFRERVLQIIPVERDRILTERLNEGIMREAMSISDNLMPDFVKTETNKLLDLLIGALHGLSASLKSP